MIFLPTYKRLHNLQRFIDHAIATEVINTIMVGVNADDDSYENIEFPSFMHIMKLGHERGSTEALQTMYEHFPNEPWYCNIADDVVPRTKHWDRYLSDAAMQHGFISCRSREDGEPRAHHLFVSGNFLYAVGGYNYLKFRHFASDSYLNEAALYILSSSLYTNEIFLEHLHHTYGKAQLDHTYLRQFKGLENPEDNIDLKRWNAIMGSPYLEELLEAAKQRFEGNDISLPAIPKDLQDL